MWDIILNEAEDVVRDSLESWVILNSLNISLYSGKWVDLINNNIMLVSREQRFDYDRVPFIIIKIDGISEGLVGFSEGVFGLDANVSLIINGNFPLDLSDGVMRELVIKDGKGFIHKFIVVDSMFITSNNVGIDDFVGVLNQQAVRGVVVYKDVNGNIVLDFPVDKISVVKDDIFGLGGMDIVGSVKWRRGVVLRGSLNFVVGCQSVRARSELKDLLNLYFLEVRKLVGNGVLAFNDKVIVYLNSVVRGLNDSDLSVGGGDLFKLLYLGGYTMDILIYAVDSGDDVDSDLLNNLNVVQSFSVPHDC